MKLFRKGQGAIEYLLMLAAVVVIVAIAVYYVTSIGGSPGVSASAEGHDSEIRISVSSGSIPAGDWQYSVSTTPGTYEWKDGTVELKAQYVSLGTYAANTYYVSLKHKPSGHVYITEQTITIS